MSPRANPDQERALLRRAAIAAMRLRDTEQRAGFAGDPWRFFRDRVQLLDPLAPPGAQVAGYPDFVYTQAMVGEIHAALALIIWKSRRMIVSWSACGYFAWAGGHLPNQRLYLVTRVEGDNDGEGARELIARTAWLLANLRPTDPEGRPYPPIRFEVSKLQIVFPDTGSTITGMGGNEPNKLRQVAANAVFCDEFPFWEKPEESYRALRPTLEGRGKVIIASSTAGGYFKQLVYDESDSWLSGLSTAVNTKPETAQEVVQYCPGMEAWTNRGNGFRVIALDYWADPRKQRGTPWEVQERKGRTQRDWDQEMLRKFNISAGEAVFAHEWDPARMVVKPAPLEDLEYRRLKCSLDFGYNRPALTVGVFIGPVWRVLRAHMGHRIHFSAFMGECLQLLAEWFGDTTLEYDWCCDAAGKQEGRDTDSEVEILRKKFGIRCRFKYSLIEPTLQKMRDYMTAVHRGAPCFQVDRHPSTRILIDGLSGGYAFPEARPGKREPEAPEKDGFYEHPLDTLRYMVLNFGGHRAPPMDLAAIASRDILTPKNFILR